MGHQRRHPSDLRHFGRNGGVIVSTDSAPGTVVSENFPPEQPITSHLTIVRISQQYRLQRIRWERGDGVEERRGDLGRGGSLLRPGSRARSARGAGAGRSPYVADRAAADGKDEPGSGVAAPFGGGRVLRDDLCRPGGCRHPGGRHCGNRGSVEVGEECMEQDKIQLHQYVARSPSSRGGFPSAVWPEVTGRDR